MKAYRGAQLQAILTSSQDREWLASLPGFFTTEGRALRYGEPQSWSGRFRDKFLLPCPEIEPRLFCRSGSSLVVIPTNLIIFSHLRLLFTCSLFSSNIPAKTIYAFKTASMNAKCAAHLVSNLITLSNVLFGKGSLG